MGATINALAMDTLAAGALPATGFRRPMSEGALADHFRLDLVRGSGGFVVVVRSLADYAAVLLLKILREIS
jgi:hypothetical protein